MSNSRIAGPFLESTAEALESRLLFAAVPAPFQSQDVGAVVVPGSASFDANGGIFTVQGAGTDVFSAADAFHYVFQTLSGDGTIKARVLSVTGSVPADAPSGIVLRSSLDPTASNVFLASRVEDKIIANARPDNGGNGGNLIVADQTKPVWLELVRSGNTVSAETSTDGTNFTLVAPPVTLSGLGASAFVGLAVASHDPNTLATATFDNVSVTPALPATGPTAALSAAPITAGTPSPYTFTVTYASAAGVKASSIGNGNIVVTGPNGFSQPATVVSPPSANGTPLTVTYQLPKPTAPGLYTVTLVPNQVTDANGVATQGQVLGTFTVAGGTLTPSVRGLVTNAKTGQGIAGRIVFFDINQNGRLDAGEPTEITDATGNYIFGPATPGVYRVREVINAGETLAVPAAGFYDETVVAGQTTSGADFADNVPLAPPVAPNLSGTFVGKIPATLSNGKASKISVRVLNNGSAKATGTMSIALFTSANSGMLDTTAVALESFAVKVNLKPKGRKVFHLSLQVPANTIKGSRFLIGAVDASNQIVESNEIDNLVIDGTPVTIS